MRALILVDIQNDFLPGGALAVPRGDEIISVVNRLIPAFPVVAASRDWHPPDHGSFAANHPGQALYSVIELNGLSQKLWPVHCVQHTPGADLPAALDPSRLDRVFLKGVDPAIDSYSAFFDNARRRATGLHEWLAGRGVSEVFVCGLATDYCVRFTVLDAIELGWPTTVIADACRGLEAQPGDSARALETMRQAGARVRQVMEVS